MDTHAYFRDARGDMIRIARIVRAMGVGGLVIGVVCGLLAWLHASWTDGVILMGIGGAWLGTAFLLAWIVDDTAARTAA
jgi:hypothetical protein